jgi:putative addiction module component (TIGR02574 family)
MTKAEILAELPKLTPAELAEVQAKLDELAGDGWLDDGQLSPAHKAALEAELAEYERNPDAGSSWEEVQARLRAKLHQ